MLTGAVIGFLVWFGAVVITQIWAAYVFRGKSYTFTPNYGGMVVITALGASIGYFVQ